MSARAKRQPSHEESARESREPGEGRPAADGRETAGAVAPPPLIYATALLVGFGLDALLPSLQLPAGARWPIGGALLVSGLGLAAWFIVSFRRAHTPVDLRKPTSALVTAGPFRISRNPGYLSLGLLYAGVTIFTSTLWAFATLAPALVVIQQLVIKREERYLERRFGPQYLRYKASTRRWI